MIGTFIMVVVVIVGIALGIEMLINHTRGDTNMRPMKMSNPNEKLMLIFGLGVVLAWVIIAATASYFSIVAEREITDSQLTVIGLLGGPALLIITNVLDLFKGKETAKINVLPDQLASDVAASDAQKAHVRLLEELRIKHDLEMELMQKAHELNMDAYVTTNGAGEE